MRKYVIGFILGIIMTLSTSVFAEELSKVGKTIAAEFVVKLNGVELPVKAVSFEGTSYAPVRVISEALGLDVGFENGEVLLTDKVVQSVKTEELANQLTLPEIEFKIKSLESGIEGYGIFIGFHEREIKEFPERAEELTKKLNELKEQQNAFKVELADLERQKAELSNK